jgi:hypothetical protein
MHKALFNNIISYSVCHDIVFNIALILVFTQIGTNLYKDKVIGLADQRRQRGCPRVPTVVFPNWRKAPIKGPYPVAMQQFPAQLTAGFQPRLDQAHVPKPSLPIASNPFQPPSSKFFSAGTRFFAARTGFVPP